MKRAKKVVTIGGGTGTFTVLSGLKKYPQDIIDITAIVTMADSGGSTGRLRDEFGYLPVGDVRMALAALAGTDDKGILRELFLYRFNKGEGLSGHNFGNLFLVALTDILGSEEKAIQYASQVLRVFGRVLPVTDTKTELVAEYEDGEVVYSEANIDEPSLSFDGTKRIKEIRLEPLVRATESVKEAIIGADLIILGPGDLYTSILPNILVDSVVKSLANTKAQIVYVVNLMTKWGQTFGFTAQDHVDEIAKYTHRIPNYILINNIPLSDNILSLYAKKREFPVEDNAVGTEKCEIVRGDLLASKMIKKTSGDTISRSLIRHDSDKLAEAIINLLED